MKKTKFTFPLKVSTNGRYFVDQKNKPFLWVGETGWPMACEYPTEIAEQYIQRRSEQGFNVIQTVLVWARHGSGNETHIPTANVNGDKPFKDKNLTKLNDKYFDHVEHLLDVAAKHDIVLAMLPTWGYYVTDWKTLKNKNAHAYGLYLGKRFRNKKNLVWMLGGDRQPWGTEDVWAAMAQGLGKGDQGKHLIGYHPSGMRSSSQYFYDAKWLDFNTIQTWGEWHRTYGFVSSDTVQTPPRPVVLSEPAYENGPEYPKGPITPLIVRRQAWWTFMAGGFYTYGQDQMWRMGEGWEKTFDTPGAIDMGKMREIISGQRWWDMVPDQSIFVQGISSERTLNAAMRTRNCDCMFLYISSQCTVWICLGKMNGKQCKAKWINPKTGDTKDAGIFETGNYGGDGMPKMWPVKDFSTPSFWEDSLLVVEAA